MGFDRSKFKTVSKQSRKRQQEELDSKTKPKGTDSSSEKRKNLKLKEGKNYVRIFPIHPQTWDNVSEDKVSNIYPFRSHFMMTKYSYTKNGEEIHEEKRLPHLCSKVHGGTKKSLLSEYIDFAHQVVYDQEQDPTERKNALAEMKHFQKGIMGGTSWACYVKVYDSRTSKGAYDRGLIYLPTSVVNGMDKLAEDEDDVEDVMASGDIFSDPNTGYMTIITKDSVAGKKDPKDYYSVKLDIRGGEDSLTDEDLKWLVDQKPLDKLFLNIYTKKDFEQSLQCLAEFDKTQPQLNLFSYDEFLDLVEEISGYFDEVKDIVEVTDKKTPQTVKAVDAKEEEVEDMPWDTPLTELSREQLVSYISRNNLPIKVRERYTKKDLIEYIQEEEKIQKAEKAAKQEEEKEETGGRKRSSSLIDDLDL